MDTTRSNSRPATPDMALWLGLALFGGAAALVSACSGRAGAERTPAAAKPDSRPVVEIVAVAPAEESGFTVVSGRTSYKRELELGFKVGGVIDRIAVDVGDRVPAGATLAWLKPVEVAAANREADAALATAEADLRRTQILFGKGFVAQARLDDAMLAVERAKAAQAARSFDRQTALIAAPANGVVLARRAEPAQVVAAGMPVLSLGDVGSGVVAHLGLRAADLAGLKVGHVAYIRDPDSESRKIAGKISAIAAQGDERTGDFDVEIAFPAASAPRAGTVVVGLFPRPVAAGRTPLMAIPPLALIDARADQGFVFVVDAGNHAHKRAIMTAGLSNDAVMIAGGLVPGERIVAAGGAYVRDGDEVVGKN